jgi:hypothetical protein
MSNTQIHELNEALASPAARRFRVPLGVVVAVIYALLVLLMWGPLGWKQGLPYETGFPVVSQSAPWWYGLIIWGDALRPYTSLFYQLSYVLSVGLGITGSFLTYQLVYAALWFGRGWLVFLIFRRLLARYPLFAFVVGALVICHASDHALEWVGQMNQFGMIFWMCLSVYLLVGALDARRWWAAGLWLLGAMAACHLALWSYESELFIICLAPLLLVTMRYGLSRRTAALVLLYWIVPLIYVGLSAQRYFGAAGTGSYQESVLRHDFTAAAIAGDWGFNIDTSLRFWKWGSGMPHSPYYQPAVGWIAGGAAALVFILGVLLVRRRSAQEEPATGDPADPLGEGESRSTRRRSAPLPSFAKLLKVLAAGILLLVLSFPAYLILSSSRMVWRTQFLSGIGGAMVFAALLGLIAVILRYRPWRLGVVAVGGAAVVFCAAWASYQMADFHYGVWERHRRTIAQVLQVAPRVRANTIVVLLGIPKAADPFGDTMWCDMAIRLAYPSRVVAGTYYYKDGTEPPGRGLQVVDGKWKWDGKGYPPLIREAPLSDMILVQTDPAAAPRLLDKVPAFMTGDPAAQAQYHPQALIYGHKPVKMARLRYIR